MFHKNLNKVQITGHHNTVIQFINTEGQLLEEKKLEVFLAPYTKALKEQIELLQKNLLDK